jgi:NhaP-type Na+/H+ or K+/H+ antiporter
VISWFQRLLFQNGSGQLAPLHLAYTIAESANLSGIVAVLFCGMVMGRYTRQNLDKAGLHKLNAVDP